MIYVYGAIIAVGLVGIFLRNKALKRRRLQEALQMLVDELVELYADESEGTA